MTHRTRLVDLYVRLVWADGLDVGRRQKAFRKFSEAFAKMNREDFLRGRGATAETWDKMAAKAAGK